MYLTRNRRRVLTSIQEPQEKEYTKLIIEEKEKDTIYCLICWEPEEKDINPITKMQEIYLFNYICDCDCNFHPNCFLEWATKTNTCPICRKPLTVNLEMYYKITLGDNYKLKLFCKKIGNYIWTVIYFPVKYLFLAWILYVIIQSLYVVILDDARNRR